MKKLVTLTAVLGAATAMAVALAAVPKVAQAGHLSCGDTLTASTSLDEDLTCGAGSGLIIGAINVVVDLNGYTLTGTSVGFANVGVDNSGGFDGMKVKNGTIVGFDSAVRVADASRVQLNHLIVSGDREYHAIDMVDSDKVDIKHSSITMASPLTATLWWNEAMRLESISRLKVHNVDVHGGFIGVNFACGDCDASENPTNGEIKESTFTGSAIGILIANSTDALVKGNHASGTVDVPEGVHGLGPFTIGSKGISVDSDFGTSGLVVSGVKLKDNHVHDNEGIGIRVKSKTATTTSDILVEDNLVLNNGADGILLVDADDSEIKGNLVNDNGGDGIALTSDSTGNDIKSNFATGNGGDDMSHDGGSTPNVWEGNTCGSSDGGDIDCP